MKFRISCHFYPAMLTMPPTTFFKALADDTRLGCVLLLMHTGELCVCDLMTALDTSQPKMSRHLAILKKSRVVTDERRGQWVYYRLNTQMPAWAYEAIKATTLGNGETLATLNKRLQTAASCC